MSYQLLPNLIFFFCILGIIILILRRLPEAQNLKRDESAKPNDKLQNKGLPAESFSKIWSAIKFRLHQFWTLALEAKDLRPKTGAYKLKSLFQFKTRVKSEVTEQPLAPATVIDAAEEKHLLDLIKADPKNLEHYDLLGRHYLARAQYKDAEDIYLYLVGHQVSSAEYHARLAKAAFHNKNMEMAESHYQKSLTLDKMHPSRYYNLGLVQENLGKWQEAKMSFEQAASMDPENLKFKSALEKIQSKIDSLNKA